MSSHLGDGMMIAKILLAFILGNVLSASMLLGIFVDSQFFILTFLVSLVLGAFTFFWFSDNWSKE